MDEMKLKGDVLDEILDMLNERRVNGMKPKSAEMTAISIEPGHENGETPPDGDDDDGNLGNPLGAGREDDMPDDDDMNPDDKEKLKQFYASLGGDSAACG